MTLSVKKGTFTKSTSTGVPVSQPVTGVGFQPKALWLWGTTVTASTIAEGYGWFYGFSDGTAHASVGTTSADAGTTAIAASLMRNDAVATIMSPTARTELARASVTSFDSDGFTLSWAVNNSTGYIIHYLAVGGTDITNAKVISTTAGVTGTGNKAYTGVGFQPEFANFLVGAGSANVQAINTVTGTGQGWGAWIGAALSTTKRWVFGVSTEDNAATADTFQYYQNDKCLCSYNFATGAVDMEADFISFDSDGLTVNYTDAPVSASQLIAFIAIKGGAWDVGEFAGNNTTGNQTITMAAGGDIPKGVMMFSKGDATTDSAAAGEANNCISIGGADGSLNMGCIATRDETLAGFMQTAKISLTTALMRVHGAVQVAAARYLATQETLASKTCRQQTSLQ